MSIALCLATCLTFQEGSCQLLSKVSALICAKDNIAIMRRLSDRKSDTYIFKLIQLKSVNHDLKQTTVNLMSK